MHQFVNTPKRLLGMLAMMFAVSWLSSCGGGNSNSSPSSSIPATPTLQSISVTPGNASVAAGLTQQFTATGTFSDGSMKPLTTGVTWSTSDATLATVDGNGLATTLKAGSATISAASASVMGHAPLTIGPAQPVNLVVSPAAASVVIGSSTPTKLSALLNFTDKSVVDVSSQSTWSSANPLNATVDATGNVVTVRRGYSRITATNGSFSASADFAVIAAPRYLYFASDEGLEMSRATVDANNGQIRMEGYIPTTPPGVAAVSTAFHCDNMEPAGQFLYDGSGVVVGPLTGQIQIYSADAATGTLSPLPNSPFSEPSPVGCIDFDPTGQFAFASSNIDNATQILTFSKNSSTGALTLLNSMDVGGTPTRVAVDPFGKYIYTSIFSNGFRDAAAAGYVLDATSGSLTAIPGASFALPNTAGTFTFHPSGNFVFMANSNGASIDTYSVDRSTGKLTLASSIQTCVNPTPLRFSPDGRFAYTGCSENKVGQASTGSVQSFSVGPSGALTHLGSAHTTEVPIDLTIDSSGQFLYLGTITSYIDCFQVDAQGIARFLRRVGTLTNRSASIAVLGGTSAVQYSPKFAYISSIGDNMISAYSVQADGSLFSTSSAVLNEQAPFSLSLVPFGNDLMVGSTAPNPNLTAYLLNPITGLIGPAFIFGNLFTPADAAVGAVTIDSSGQFAFETDAKNEKIYPYFRGLPIGNQSSWSIATFVDSNHQTLPFASTGATPGPVIVDPAGTLVYVGNQGDNTISAYVYFGSAPELNESTSAVTAPFTDGSPFAIGAKPLAFAFDPNEAFLYVICEDQTLRTFAIDYTSRGHIAQVTSTPLGAVPVGLAAEPSGHFVYVANSSGVSAFALNAQTGGFTAIPLTPAISLSNVNGVYVEPSGRFLYVTTSTANPSPGSGAVFAYNINSDGTLTAVAGNPVATPNQPSSMVFSAQIQ